MENKYQKISRKRQPIKDELKVISDRLNELEKGINDKITIWRDRKTGKIKLVILIDPKSLEEQA